MACLSSTASQGALKTKFRATYPQRKSAAQGSFQYRVWRPSPRLTPNSLISQPGWRQTSFCKHFPKVNQSWSQERAFSQPATILEKFRASAAVVEKAASLSKPPAEPATPTLAEQARTLVEISDEGTLCTVGQEGFPIGTHARYALLQEGGNPVLLLHPNALHTKHVEADSRCTLHIQVLLPGGHKPQVTLKGLIRRPEQEDGKRLKALQASWERKYGENKHDHDVYELEVEEVLFAPDLGVEEVWVAGQDYIAAKADPLRDCAPAIVNDMNQLNFEDIQRFPRVLVGDEQAIDVARMTWVDRLGFNLQVLYHGSQQLQEMRVAFPREVVDERDARSSLTMLAQLAWEKEKPYVPPEIKNVSPRLSQT